MNKKFCLTTSRQSDAVRYQRESLWFRHCEEEQIPYVQVRQRAKLADIHWDYITYLLSRDDAFNGEYGARLRSEVREMFARVAYDNRNTTMCYMVSGWTADFHDVPNAIAESLACELYDLVARHLLNFKVAMEKKPT
ncbi:hypothetical protein HWI03_002722 [Salmonella enterica]|nr:hypothetical protein [Salmonella enterica]EIC4367723.1 hypothetical protein [Salmonella enterica]EKC5811953.1 hypothetical protein [Salmonella enterica]